MTMMAVPIRKPARWNGVFQECMVRPGSGLPSSGVAAGVGVGLGDGAPGDLEAVAGRDGAAVVPGVASTAIGFVVSVTYFADTGSK
jgi:hypothetical protein